MARIIKSTAMEDADRWLQTMTTIIVKVTAEPFSVTEGKNTRANYMMN